jgi:hypothetical protein
MDGFRTGDPGAGSLQTGGGRGVANAVTERSTPEKQAVHDRHRLLHCGFVSTHQNTTPTLRPNSDAASSMKNRFTVAPAYSEGVMSTSAPPERKTSVPEFIKPVSVSGELDIHCQGADTSISVESVTARVLRAKHLGRRMCAGTWRSSSAAARPWPASSTSRSIRRRSSDGADQPSQQCRMH